MSGPVCMGNSRSILKSKRDELVVKNIIHMDRDFEDWYWYVNPTVIQKSICEKY